MAVPVAEHPSTPLELADRLGRPATADGRFHEVVERSDAPATLEAALTRTEADAERALRSANAHVKQLRKVRAAAASGNLRDLTRTLETAKMSDAEAHEATVELTDGWRFDESEYLDSDGFARELGEMAEAHDFAIIERDGRLLTYPSVIRVVAADAAVEIDRKRERRIRPSVLVQRLKAARQKPPRFKPEAFIEALRTGYDYELARRGKRAGADVPLVDVYGALTMLPGSGREYSKQEFARDVHLLDRSGVKRTKDGSTLRLPAATGTRGSRALATVTQNDELRFYYAIAFDR